MSSGCLCIFGEVLFDHFPDGKRVLGGAPFNVAWHLQAFTQPACFHSRVGLDSEGEQIRSAMTDWGMTTEYLQSDPARSTGMVNVIINDNEPTYDIVPHCAYDAIEPVTATVDCQLLYHGSLALRESQSWLALQSLKQQKPRLIFVDVNLRPPWWQKDQLDEMLKDAHWVKLNTDELEQLAPDEDGNEQSAAAFLQKHQLRGLIITHGADGAEILSENGDHFQVEPVGSVEIVDTVGAGDAFTSIIILGLTNDWSLEQTLERAQEFASAIVGQRGATIKDRSFYQSYIDAWL